MNQPAGAVDLGPRAVIAVAAGGALGASARYALTLWWPGEGAGFPLGVFVVNAVGCALIGVLMVLLADRSGSAPALLRPFFGVGLLGGFTSFSAYAADTVRLLEEAAYATAVGYGLGTVAVALVAVWGGTALTRWALGVDGLGGTREAGPG